MGFVDEPSQGSGYQGRGLGGMAREFCSGSGGGAGGALRAVAGARPPVFFARRPAFEAALSAWTGDRIVRALDRLQATILEVRRNPALEVEITRQTLLAMAIESARSRQSS